MPTLRNADVNPEIRDNALAALIRLGEMKLPGKGVLRLRKIRRQIAEHWRDVAETLVEVQKRYVELDEEGEIIQKVQDGRSIATFRGGSDQEEVKRNARAYNKEVNEIMEDEFEVSIALGPDHLGMKNLNAESSVTANLLFQLGDLFEEPEEKE